MLGIELALSRLVIEKEDLCQMALTGVLYNEKEIVARPPYHYVLLIYDI